MGNSSMVSIAAVGPLRPEGTGGTTTFEFALTRQGDVLAAASVDWVVSGAGSHPVRASDFAGGILPSGRIDFAAGQATQVLRIDVATDAIAEWDEGFAVALHAPTSGMTLGVAVAEATVGNDDAGAPEIPIALVSASAAGIQADAYSVAPAFSPDGRRIAFWSSATNLVAGDTNATYDVFVKDLVTGAITLVSANATGDPAHRSSMYPVFSPDGNSIAFYSAAADLVDGDTNDTYDVFIKDLTTGAIARVSTDAAGNQGDGSVLQGRPIAFSGDGRRIVFTSLATNLVAGDTNGASDVFVKDLVTGAVERVSVDAQGRQANDASSDADISRDGRRVIFTSAATNLVAGDTNVRHDIFMKDLVTGTVTRLSTDAGGVQGNSYSNDAAFSPDGSMVAFHSNASNLVTGDSNNTYDIFLKDPLSGAIARISTTSTGGQANADSSSGRFSADGTRILFSSSASNLVSGDTNGTYDIFVKSLLDGSISRVSTNAGGRQGNSASSTAAFSPDGTKVAFASAASNLLDGDTNGSYDVYLKDLLAAPVVTVSLAQTPVTVAEGRTTAKVSIQIERDGLGTGPQSVSWMAIGTGPDRADADDFTAKVLPSGTITFAEGQTKQTIVISIAGDRAVEPDETFQVVLYGASDGLGIANGAVPVVIRNDDATVGFATAASSVTEGSGSGALELTRSGDLASTVKVAWTIAGSGASPASPADFIGGVLPTGVVTFAAGEASKTLFLPILNDRLVESAETVTVTLATPTIAPAASAVALGLSSATITILDDDAVPPPAPTTPDLTAADDLGRSRTDDLTSVTMPLFTGRALAGGTIRLFDGVTLLGTGVVGPFGNWAVRAKPLAEGSHAITAKVSTAAGVTSEASGALTVTIDATPPATPTVPDLAPASDSGRSNADNLTRETTVVVRGRADPGTQVTLYEGGNALGSGMTGALGNWAIELGSLTPGVHLLTAQSMDAAFNVSGMSAALAITIDTAFPAAPTAPDLAPASDSGLSAGDNLTNVTTPVFQGRGEAGAVVTLYDGATEGQAGTVVGTGTVGALGNWAVRTSVLSQGSHSISARITDAAGNLGSAATAAVIIETTPPAPPSVPDLVPSSDTGASMTDNVTSDTTPTFQGRAEPAARVTLLADGVAVGTGTVGAWGNWAITAAALPAGTHRMSAQATDPAGNISDASGVVVVQIATAALAGAVPAAMAFLAAPGVRPDVLAPAAAPFPHQPEGFTIAAGGWSPSIVPVGEAGATSFRQEVPADWPWAQTIHDWP